MLRIIKALCLMIFLVWNLVSLDMCLENVLYPFSALSPLEKLSRIYWYLIIFGLGFGLIFAFCWYIVG